MISHDSLIFLSGAFGGAWTMLVGISLWGQVYRLRHLGPTEDDSRPARPREHEIPVVIDMRGKKSAARRLISRLGAALSKRREQARIHVAHRKHEADQCQARAHSRRCGSAGADCGADNCHGSGGSESA